MSEFVAPQLAKPAPKNKPLGHEFWDDYLLEPKHDGMRAVVVVGEGEVLVQSRTNKPYAEHVPHLVEGFKHLPTGTVLDGELAVVNDSVMVRDRYVPVVDFNATMRIMGSGWEKARVKQVEAETPISFILFDIPQYGYHDLTGFVQTGRRHYLDQVFSHQNDLNNFVLPNPQFFEPQHYQEIYDSLMDNGIEGAIMKNKNASYEPGKRQNKAWYKFKTTGTADVVITGFTDAKEGVGGKYLGQIGAVKFGAYDEDHQLVQVGQTSGMNDAERLEWTEIRDRWDPSVDPIPLTSDGLAYVLEIKYNDLVGTGTHKTPRHPQYLTLREDKAPADCTMDQFKA